MAKKRGKRREAVQKMTPIEAITFDRYSPENAAVLLLAAQERGCDCQPYSDWFTLRRWNAQGFLVNKGQHGITLSTVVHKKVERDGEEKDVSYTKPYTVFCRCQVHPMEPRADDDLEAAEVEAQSTERLDHV